MGHHNAMQYGMSFMLIALEEHSELEREKAALFATAARAAYHASNEDFGAFVNKLNGEADKPKPISEAEIAAIFG